MALRVQIYKLSCKHLNVRRFIRNGESINIRFYANYIAAKQPKAKEISAFCKLLLLQPNKETKLTINLLLQRSISGP